MGAGIGLVAGHVAANREKEKAIGSGMALFAWANAQCELTVFLLRYLIKTLAPKDIIETTCANSACAFAQIILKLSPQK